MTSEADIAASVRRAREQSGLTRSALAARVGTSRAALDQIEKGQRVPRVDTLLRVLDATGGELSIHLRSPSTATRSLAAFTAELDVEDARWAWRSLVSDFVANEFVPATAAERSGMLQPEPALFVDSRWNCFVAALAEHMAFHAQADHPPWASDADRAHVQSFWWPVHGELPSTRAAALATSPASFKRRRILVDANDLPLIVP